MAVARAARAAYAAVTARALEAPDPKAVREVCAELDDNLEIARCKREARLADRRTKKVEVQRGASEYKNENGSWVRQDGIIVVPGSYADFKVWAVDPAMSGDFQIILLVVASILSAFGYEEYGIPRQVSGGVFTFLKALGIAWASLYWCTACQDFVLSS
eukprot:PRCOL_00006346-RA